MDDSTEFRTDGGATWLNLLATKGQSFGARPIERLHSADALHRWLVLMGMPPTQAPTEGDLEAAIHLREELRTLAMSAAGGASVAELDFGPISDIAEHGSPAVIASDSHVDVRSGLAALAIQAAVTLRGPDRRFLTQCDEADCRWVFLDPSGRRRWCPAPACASRGRVRAHRAAAGRAPSSGV